MRSQKKFSIKLRYIAKSNAGTSEVMISSSTRMKAQLASSWVNILCWAPASALNHEVYHVACRTNETASIRTRNMTPENEPAELADVNILWKEWAAQKEWSMELK